MKGRRKVKRKRRKIPRTRKTRMTLLICKIFYEELIKIILQGYTFDDIRQGTKTVIFDIRCLRLTVAQYELFRENNKDIIICDNQFEIAFKVFVISGKTANRNSLVQYIKENYYMHKAVIKLLFKFLIKCIYWWYYYYYKQEYSCIDEIFEGNRYWINSEKKCKVVEIMKSKTKIMRYIYFCIFILLKMIIRFFYLILGFPKLSSLIIILNICYKNSEYIFLFIIFIFEFKDNTNCFQSENEHLFYKKNKYYDLNNVILDILLNNIFKN